MYMYTHMCSYAETEANNIQPIVENGNVVPTVVKVCSPHPSQRIRLEYKSQRDKHKFSYEEIEMIPYGRNTRTYVYT